MRRKGDSRDHHLGRARSTGYPVVLKIASPEITHKSDVGGVQLDLRDDQMVREAFQRILDYVKTHHPEARIDGVTVQKMVDRKEGIEMILGVKKDNVFGTILMIGMGGVYAELFGDRALGLPPLNEALTRNMLRSLKIFPLH